METNTASAQLHAILSPLSRYPSTRKKKVSALGDASGRFHFFRRDPMHREDVADSRPAICGGAELVGWCGHRQVTIN